MMMKSKTLIALLVAALITPPLAAQRGQERRDEQERVRDATQRGEVRSLRSIENSIVPRMRNGGADYIGQEFDGERNRYRLKFMRGNSVIWVDVDGRTGAILGQTGG
jgi:uncharacterized membrane protein YkoI